MDGNIDIQKLLEENEKLKKELNVKTKNKTLKKKDKRKEKRGLSLKLFLIIFFVLILIISGFCLYFNFEKLDIEKIKNNIVFIMVYDKDDELISTGSGVYIMRIQYILMLMLLNREKNSK